MKQKPSIQSSFLRQILLFAVFIIVSLVFFRMCIKAYTHHGQSISVPDFRQSNMEEVKQLAKKNDLKYVVEDSTFNNDLPPGFVLDQNPRPNSRVKQNRTIYLVINSSTPPPVRMPDLIDNSLRQATLKLENLGLKVGQVTYKPDIAKAVLEQTYKGKPIAADAQVLKGESIDLVIGDGFGNTTMQIPDLVGLSYEEAKFTLRDYGLLVGSVQKTSAVSDENTAIVYEQSPSSTSGETLEMGQTVDLYLTDI